MYMGIEEPADSRLRKNVFAVNMPRLAITTFLTLPGRRRSGSISVEPIINHLVVLLFIPQNSGKGLSLDLAHLIGKRKRADAVKKGIGLLPAPDKNSLNLLPKGLPQAAVDETGEGGMESGSMKL